MSTYGSLHCDSVMVIAAIVLKLPCQNSPCQNNGECIPDITRTTYHCVCKTGFFGTHCEDTVCKFDFEDGIDGWEKTGTVFNNQPTYGDNPSARNRGQPANQQGDWWIGGFEDRPSKTAPPGGIQGDGPQGTLTSPFFSIRGNNISFLIGGGCDINLIRAELIVNGQVVRSETGYCNETMTRVTWDVQDFIGKRARVRLVDASSGPWSHINFDDLKGDISCKQD
ncbi:hypothetical protein OS493_031310 [Desmophyllum pertusum]|uniref:EGF-like domain-containing protein n=1 Tax=Desmophyllum pertusum TaxID=174260 RepID=A0A9X0CP71_9CNID|nr:hypothetical protein OS493_031310 [Desmophyllum pertusum]